MTPNQAFQLLVRLPRNMGRGLIWIYRHTLSAIFGRMCRHLPTCSEYADEALHRHGLWAGGWMTLGRICRCHPYGTSGLDFVLRTMRRDARWYLPWRYALWRTTNEDVREDVRAEGEAVPPARQAPNDPD